MKIRDYAYRNYIIPARTKKAPTVTFCAGPIREAFAIVNRMSIIFDAIDTRKFEKPLKVYRERSLKGSSNA